MRINNKILSIPPYISTSWKNVLSLSLDRREEGSVLVIQLQNNQRIEIPRLEGPIVELIFAAYEKYLESTSKASIEKTEDQGSMIPGATTFAFPFPINASQIDNLPGLLQHNPEQADAEDLPAEILDKIASVATMLDVKDLQMLPQAEPHCNCMHCQIARTIHHSLNSAPQETVEEEVSDADLKFRLWDIEQLNDKLYAVKNPEDSKECYHVYLGNPVGCTCGEKNCAHIHAVLNS